MTGKLTTHVLNTHTGQPAQGLAIELWREEDREWQILKKLVTNSDGRVDGPILEGDGLVSGTYELRFLAGDYLRHRDDGLKEPLFIDVVPIRFGINDTTSHYHVPLLLSAHGYTTYRGS